LSTLVRAVTLEAGIYATAWLRMRVGPRIDGVWSRSASTKRSFGRQPPA
jgi:hypothetical protein